MPMDRSKYPPDWEKISERIRARADGLCECDGRCGAHRWPCAAENGRPHPVTGSLVVLTVAHLDHDTTNNRDSNLLAMCQRCHLNYDAEHHAKNAARTRAERGRHPDQPPLPFE